MSRSSMQQIVFSVGSNFQQDTHFKQAFDALQAIFGELIISSVYDNPPIHQSTSVSESRYREDDSVDSGRHYYNAVVGVMSDQSISDIKAMLVAIEDQCGRDRCAEQVCIDIDLILYGDRIDSVNNVVVPHQDILTNAYILRPLAEVFPDMLHPVTKISFFDLWQAFLQRVAMPTLEPVDFVWRDKVISVSPSCLLL